MELVMLLGAILGLVGYSKMFLAAFEEGSLWGILCLVIPLFAIYYGITRGSKVSNALVLLLVGNIVFLIGYFLAY